MNRDQPQVDTSSVDQSILDSQSLTPVTSYVRKANATAARIAGILALITVAMLVWFALDNVANARGSTGEWPEVVLTNVIGSVITAALLLVASGLMFARRIAGAWTLCIICVLSVLAMFVTPLLRGTPISDQLTFLFGFSDEDDTAIGLVIVFGVLTAIVAGIAGMLTTNESTAPPPHQWR